MATTNEFALKSTASVDQADRRHIKPRARPGPVRVGNTKTKLRIAPKQTSRPKSKDDGKGISPPSGAGNRKTRRAAKRMAGVRLESKYSTGEGQLSHKSLEGLSVEEACSRIHADKFGEPTPTSVPPTESSTPAPTPEEKEEARERKFNEIIALMEDRCALMWLNKDTESVADTHVVVTKLATIARAEKLYTVIPPGTSSSEVIQRMVDLARTNSIKAKIKSELRRVVADRVAEHFEDLPSLKMAMERIAKLSPIEQLTEMRTWKRASLYHFQDKPFTLLGSAIKSAKVVSRAVSEEAMKLVLCLLIFWTIGRLSHYYAFYSCIICVAAIGVLETIIRDYGNPHQRWWSMLLLMVYRAIAHVVFTRMLTLAIDNPDSPFFILFLLAAPHPLLNLIFYHLGYESLMMSFECLGIATSDPNVATDLCAGDWNVPIPPTQVDFNVSWGEEKCEPNFGTRMFWGIAGVIPTVYRACTCNEKVAMCGRVGKALPMHASQNAASKVLGRWKAAIKEFAPLFEGLLARTSVPIPFQDWAATFPPHRRDAFLKMHAEGFDPLPRVLYASSFIKKEKALRNTADPLIKDPRFIQGCPIELSACCGPYLRPFAKNVRQSLRPVQYSPQEIGSGKQIVYTCGLTNDDIGVEFSRAIDYISEHLDIDDELVFIEDDQSRFDLHLTEGPFRFLNSVYRSKLPRKVANALRRKVCVGRTNLGTKYSIPFTMQSGWPDTSVGDTLVNAIMKYAAHGVGQNWISIICGDDSITVTTRKALEARGGPNGLITSYQSFGMEVTLKVSDDPLDVEFCSGRFHPCRGSYLLVPKTGRILARICFDVVDRAPRKHNAWLRGISETLLHFGRVDPLLAALGKNLDERLGEGLVIKEAVNEYGHRYGDGVIQPSWEDTCMYYDAHYSMSEADVRECVAVISQSQLGTFTHSSLLHHLAMHDV